jgi:hypothetical protein
MLTFDEKPWLAPYIDANISKRQAAKNEFEKGFYKLLNNSLFGKTMENVRKYRRISLVQDASQLARRVRKATYRRTVPLAGSDTLAAVEMAVGVAKLDKPIYVGQAVLDISKAHMAAFHHGVWRQLFGGASRLLFTDTDSLAYEVRYDGDAYAKLEAIKGHLDTSSYPEGHPLASMTNTGVTGVFKDEMPSKVALGGVGTPPIKCLGVMSEFVGLRAKMYAYSKRLLPWPLPEPGSPALLPAGAKMDVEDKRAKGISRVTLRNEVRLADYRTLAKVRLQDLTRDQPPPPTSMRHHVVSIRSRRHILTSERASKRSLSAYDDKRHVLQCGKHTLAHGNGRIANGEGRPECPFCSPNEVVRD